MISQRLVFKVTVAFTVAVASAPLSSCSKSVGHDGNKGGSAQAVTEPSPVPSPSPIGAPSPQPSVSPSPAPSRPVGDCGEGPALSRFSQTSLFTRGQFQLVDLQATGTVSGLLDSDMKKSDIGTSLPNDPARMDLAVRGELRVSDTRVLHGAVVASSRLRHSDLESPLGRRIGNVDSLLDVEKQGMALHSRLKKLPANGQTELVCPQAEGCEFFFTGESPSRNVFLVKSADLHRAIRIRFTVPAASTAVVRVEGNDDSTLTIVSQEIDLGNLSASRLIWNVTEVRNLHAHNRTLPGTWLAPGTLMHANHSIFQGTLFTSCFNASGTRIEHATFDGCLP